MDAFVHRQREGSPYCEVFVALRKHPSGISYPMYVEWLEDCVKTLQREFHSVMVSTGFMSQLVKCYYAKDSDCVERIAAILGHTPYKFPETSPLVCSPGVKDGWAVFVLKQPTPVVEGSSFSSTT